MRRNVYLYLFIFSVLIALVLYMNGSRRIHKLENELKITEESKTTLLDSLQGCEDRYQELNYFSLDKNDDALAYFEEYDLDNPALYIADKLLETNRADADNPFVPYQGMKNFFQINKVRVLNHRWIIADYSDGQYWGDLIIRYEVNDDLSVTFKVMDYLIYTRS